MLKQIRYFKERRILRKMLKGGKDWRSFQILSHTVRSMNPGRVVSDDYIRQLLIKVKARPSSKCNPQQEMWGLIRRVGLPGSKSLTSLGDFCEGDNNP